MVIDLHASTVTAHLHNTRLNQHDYLSLCLLRCELIDKANCNHSMSPTITIRTGLLHHLSQATDYN